MREAVRSGRRSNFFITENKFIDFYARKVGGNGVAVYCLLQRCANSETRETWIGADKMAEVLDMDRSTVYRYLKQLEDFRLIRTLRTREKTIYIVLPVPPPPSEAAPTPLFDAIDGTTSEPQPANQPLALAQVSLPRETNSHTSKSSVASLQHPVAPPPLTRRTGEKRNKEEQDLLNKTQEQDFFNKIFEWGKPEIHEAAQRIVEILKLPDASLEAVMAAVELKARGTNAAMDKIVEEIWNKILLAERRDGSCERYLDNCMAEILAERILDEINLPPMNGTVAAVTAALKAEAKDRKTGLEETAAIITNAAIEDRRRGTDVNRFYFENCKWRSNGGVSKAERRKLDNLEVNARVKQRLREKFEAAGMD